MAQHDLIPGITVKAQWPTSKSQAVAVSKSYEAALASYRSQAAQPCVYCGHVSKLNELVDTDAALNRATAQRWRVVCSACHGYLHIGQEPIKGLKAFEDGFLGSMTRLLHVDPKFGPSSATLNHLFRAVGLAMASQSTQHVAMTVYKQLADERSVAHTKAAYGTNLATDLGKAMSELAKDPKRYADRKEALEGVRLIFHPKVLRSWGAKLLDENNKLDPSTWPDVLSAKLARIKNEMAEFSAFSITPDTSDSLLGVPQSVADLDPVDDL